MSKKHLRDTYLTPDEFERLLQTALKWRPDMAFMIYLAGALGLSCGEVVRLRRRAFRRLGSTGKVMVPTMWGYKHRHGRFPPDRAVLADATTKRVIREYLRAMPKEQDYLFPALRVRAENSRKHMAPVTVRVRFKEVVLRAGLNPKYSFHSLRHYRGMVLWRTTKDLKFVRQQLRNSQYFSTKRYKRMGG